MECIWGEWGLGWAEDNAQSHHPAIRPSRSPLLVQPFPTRSEPGGDGKLKQEPPLPKRRGVSLCASHVYAPDTPHFLPTPCIFAKSNPRTQEPALAFPCHLPVNIHLAHKRSGKFGASRESECNTCIRSGPTRLSLCPSPLFPSVLPTVGSGHWARSPPAGPRKRPCPRRAPAGSHIAGSSTMSWGVAARLRTAPARHSGPCRSPAD